MLDFERDPRWDAFVSAHRDGLVYHHSTWLTVLEREYGQKCRGLACETRQGELRAILPLFFTKGLPFRVGCHVTGHRLSSLPRTPIAGPLALDCESQTEILRSALELAGTAGAQLEIKTSLDALHEHVAGLVQVPWRLTYINQLPPKLEGQPWQEFSDEVRLPRICGQCADCRRLRFGSGERHRRLKWSVNKAIKNGLRVREAETEQDLRHWYPLYLERMRANVVPARPYRFFKALWDVLKPKGLMRLLVVEEKNGGSERLLAGSIFFAFGQTVFYGFNGASEDDMHLGPNDLLQWKQIHDSCREGFRWYDLGEVADEHQALSLFKSKWGGKPVRLYRYYSQPRGESIQEQSGVAQGILGNVWNLLPLRVTEWLSDRIYSYL